MKIVAILLAAGLSLPSLIRETNSHAVAVRAEREYAKKQYADAVRDYARSSDLSPSPRASFNLGTAEIAAGEREKGSAHLEPAIKDPALRANALFNRGNSALAAKSYDNAVRDYSDALRANPSHAAAKRNLEIALARQQSAKRGGGGQQQLQGSQQQQQPQQQKPQQGQQKQRGPMDMEALLRSVQQQEQEELRRMKGRPAEGRVGW